VSNIKYILLLIVLTGGLKAMAQQDPMYTQYMNQLLSINPAYAGAKGVTSATLLVREQWVTWPGNPKTQTLFVHSPLNAEMGIGGSIINDKISVTDDRGAVSNLGIFGDYSYTITYPGERYLSFGLKAGFSFYNAQLSGLYLGKNDTYDPAFENIEFKFLPNAGVGVYFSSPDYYIGFSIPKLITNTISKSKVETGTVIKEELHAFFMGGYVFDVNRILKFKPYFMLRVTPNAPISTDVTAQLVFFERFWVGATYRVGNSFGLMLQIQLSQQLKIGYAYDLTTNELGSYNSGTHEILINYDFSFGRGRVRSPRYF
jgi:type IX secretion system PorP/SprF family membrane protein